MKTFEEYMKDAANDDYVAEMVEDRVAGTLGSLPDKKNDRIVSFEKFRSGKLRRFAVTAASAAAVAALVLFVGPGLQGGSTATDGGITVTAGNEEESAQTAALSQWFGVTAYAAEGERTAVESDGTITFLEQSGGNAAAFTGLAFRITGEGIAKVEVDISKGALYRVEQETMTVGEFNELFENSASEKETWMTSDPVGAELANITVDHCTYVGSKAEADWEEPLIFGFYGDETVVKDEDLQADFHAAIDTFDGAELHFTITYENGTEEEQSYTLQSGKLKVSHWEDGLPVAEQEFVTGDDQPYLYGILATKVE